MRKESKKEGERQTAGVFSFALMYMESNEYTSCSSGCHSLIVLIKAIVGVGIELYLNIQCFRILSHTNNVTERHFEHDLRSIKQNRFAFLVFVGGCEFKRCESIPMCLTRTEMCPKTIGCSDDAFLRCAWVCDWLPALCFLTSHADGTDTYIHTHKPLRSAAPAPGMAIRVSASILYLQVVNQLGEVHGE